MQNRGGTIASRAAQTVLLVVLVAPWPVGAASPDRPAGKRDAPAEHNTTQAVEAEDDLTRLLLDRPPVPITKPRDAEPLEPKPDLPAPGSAVVKRRCRIAYRPETGWYLLTFLPEQSGEVVQPRWVLQSEWLAAIEPLMKGPNAPLFCVSGETTVYRDRAFIFLRNVTVIGQSPQLSATATTQPKPTDSETEKAITTASQPTDKAAGSQDRILGNLLRDRPGKPIVVAAEPGKVQLAGAVAPTGNREQLSEDRGAMRIDRLVTINPESGDWRQVRFISDNTLQDQPMYLLPCKLLEEAEDVITAEKRKTVQLRITGEMTHYKGRRYLLLRKVLREREMGQF